MKEKYYERLKALSKDPNSSMLFWGYEASAILKEIERLHSIIKEVREYIDRRDIEWGSDEHNRVLEILDKENK